jgi:hypothetical protein
MKDPFYDGKTAFSQSYFLSRVVKDAKRPLKVSFFVRKNRLNPLWWIEPFSVILQISTDSSLSLRVTLSPVILSETKDLQGFKERHLQYFLLFLPSWQHEN